MEVFPGWLEPILDRFTKNWNTVAFPRLLGMSPDNFEIAEFDINSPGCPGAIRWDMNLDWFYPEETNNTDRFDPVKSPSTFA